MHSSAFSLQVTSTESLHGDLVLCSAAGWDKLVRSMVARAHLKAVPNDISESYLQYKTLCVAPPPPHTHTHTNTYLSSTSSHQPKYHGQLYTLKTTFCIHIYFVVQLVLHRQCVATWKLHSINGTMVTSCTCQINNTYTHSFKAHQQKPLYSNPQS